jgi:hypothetical protein
MKGKRPSFAWAKDSELEDSWIAASPIGWSDNELGVDWLEKLFDPATKEKAAGEWRCLVLDNHESHISMEFIEYAWSNKIVVVSLAPKTSGTTQPLDVAVFKDYAQEYGKAADEQLCGKVAISKQDFPRLLPQARRKAFTRTNIVRGFEQAGIWPFNPDRFDFMREYHEQQQNATSSSADPAQPRPLPPQPSTPKQCRARLLNEVEHLQHSPPDTPSRPMQLIKELKEQVERGRAYEAILSERIHELGATEGARSKTGDRRRVPGQSRVFNQHTLNELCEKRDEVDRVAAAKKTRAQNGSRGRPRGGRRGRGGGRGRGGARSHQASQSDTCALSHSSDSDGSESDEPGSDNKTEVPKDVTMALDEAHVGLCDTDESNKENVGVKAQGTKRQADSMPEEPGIGKRKRTLPARFQE